MKDKIKEFIKAFIYSLLTRSLRKASGEQGLEPIVKKLEAIVPDISKQYTVFDVDNMYLTTKVRNQHGFQISLVGQIIKEIIDPVIVDIGDSAGTHLQYIQGLYPEKSVSCLSVNIDLEAVKKIQEKGLDAIHARAEEINEQGIDADVFLSFETAEHLMNPCQFFYDLSSKTKAKYLVLTVPYVKKSRVGLHHIRQKRQEGVYAENTHIFELNPEDWELLAKHSGWRAHSKKIYYQYPRKSVLALTKMIWRHHDFEGFFGMVLSRDDSWSSKYYDW